MTSLIFLAAYLIFLPLVVLILLYAVSKKYPGFSFTTHWMSHLGQKGSPSFWHFSIPLFFFGLANTLFTFVLARIMPPSTLSAVALFSFAGIGPAVILVSFFPMNKSKVLHFLSGSALFFSILVSSSTMILVFLTADWPGSGSKIITAELAAIFVLSFLLMFSRLKLIAKYGLVESDKLTELRKKESSFILRNASLWEWLTFFFSILFLFSAAADLLSLLSANLIDNLPIFPFD